MRKRHLVIVAAAVLLIAPRTRGAQARASPDRASVSPIVKGRTRFGVDVGVGSTLRPQFAIGYRPSFEVAVHWGRVVSEPRGPGIFEGNFEVGLDVVPVFIVLKGETIYGFHVALCFRHYLAPDSRIRPFVSLSSGPLVTNHQLPVNTSRFNFASSLGLGVVLPASDRLTYTLEAGFQHISNADTSPHNPGLNSMYVRVGMSFFR